MPENAVTRRIMQELSDLGVPDVFVKSEYQCRSGSVDLFIYSWPRCLIEAKISVDDSSLHEVIAQIKGYGVGFNEPRLYLALGRTSNAAAYQRRLRRSGIRLWTREAAEEIAAECRRLTPEQAQIPPEVLIASRSAKSSRKTATPPEDYDDLPRTGGSRMMLKYVSVRDAIGVLPLEEQEAAKRQLRSLGVEKAAALAPLLRRRPLEWRNGVRRAQTCTVAELQHWVTSTLGLKARGRSMPGERMYRALLRAMPLEKRPDLMSAFDLAFRLNGSTNRLEAFVRIISDARPLLQGQLEEHARGTTAT